jgi:hypothetical protein
LLDVFVQAARDRGARAPISAIWYGVHTAGVISELHASHVIANWVDPDGMASLIVAVVAGTVVHEAITTGGAEHRRIPTQFAGLLLGARAHDAN